MSLSSFKSISLPFLYVHSLGFAILILYNSLAVNPFDFFVGFFIAISSLLISAPEEDVDAAAEVPVDVDNEDDGGGGGGADAPIPPYIPPMGGGGGTPYPLEFREEGETLPGINGVGPFGGE